MSGPSKPLSLAGLAVALLLVLACDPSTEVTFVNETAEVVFVSGAASSDGRIEPGGRRSWDYLEYSEEMEFSATNSEGEQVFAISVTWEELEAMKWTIAIRD